MGSRVPLQILLASVALGVGCFGDAAERPDLPFADDDGDEDDETGETGEESGERAKNSAMQRGPKPTAQISRPDPCR